MPDSGSRFLADAMLGSLARKLRILGFDTTYHRAGTDKQLLRSAAAGRRIILTSDRRLWDQHKKKGRLVVFLIQGRNDRERFLSLLEESRSHGITLLERESRCALCNGALRESRKKEQLQGRVPESVLKRHRSFSVCARCGKVYWKGRHWSRLRRFYSLLRSKRI